MSLVKEAVKVPSRSDLNRDDHRVNFCHPYYDDDNNVMLYLSMVDPITDPATGAVKGWGLYAGFALEACGIIAGNRFDGWFSESKDSSMGARVDATSILEKNQYYFHLPLREGDDADGSYGVVGSFKEWRFPHKKLPSAWTRLEKIKSPPPRHQYGTSQLPEALRARDLTCRISGCEDGTEAAHLCPDTESKWWIENNMTRYIDREESINDTSNGILLRGDLHFSLDQAYFVFAPKPSSNPEVTHLIIHLMGGKYPPPQLHNLYHNRRLQSTLDSSIPSMFARFAWALFYKRKVPPLFKRFVPRRVVPRAREGVPEASGGAPETQAAKKRKLESSTATSTATHAVLSAASPWKESPPAGSPPASTSSSRGSERGAGLDQEGTDDDLPPVAREWLARERRRSDPEGRWEEEKAWAKKVSRREATLNRESARRWYEISGIEVFDVDEAGSPFPERGGVQ